MLELIGERGASFLKSLISMGVLIFLGAFISWIFYYLKKRDLFGGFIGGMVVGVIGAIIGALLIDKFFAEYIAVVLKFLTEGAGINVLAGFLGAYIAVWIMNKLNHDKERKKY